MQDDKSQFFLVLGGQVLRYSSPKRMDIRATENCVCIHIL